MHPSSFWLHAIFSFLPNIYVSLQDLESAIVQKHTHNDPQNTTSKCDHTKPEVYVAEDVYP